MQILLTTHREYMGGYIFELRSAATFWAAVVLSTTEAEFVVACEAARETIWLRNLYSELTGKKRTI